MEDEKIVSSEHDVTNDIEGRKVSFSSLLRCPEIANDRMTYENSFVELNESRSLNTRKYKNLMKKNRLKVKVREE